MNSSESQTIIAELPSGLGELRDRVGNLEARMDSMQADLAENTASTKRVETNTSDLIDAFDSLKSAFKVFNWIGKAAKPLSYIATAAAGIVGFWTAIKAGVNIK